jgi:sulfur-oxidizing protein SoxY
MVNKTRRLLIQGALGVGAIAALVGFRRALQPSWPEAAFTARDVEIALHELTGTAEADLIPSDQIKFAVPNIAENGAIIPVTVEADLEGVESIALFAARNPHPLTSSYVIPAGTLPYVSTRIKMQETADVIAVVKANGKCYSVAKRVKVAVGGCN